MEALLGNGNHFGLNLSYKVQPSPDGLAQAFLLGEEFIGDDACCMILGDNVLYGNGLKRNLKDAVKNAENGMQVEKCAEIVTLQILKSDKGRSLLYAMKVDAEPENDIYKELVEQTTKYFLNKETFNLKAGEDIADKAQRIVADPKTRSNVLKNIIENEKRKQAAKVTKKQVNLNVQKGPKK